ncbi:hypothetical protein HALLA_00980 (plasmid) [Halostagnicola larsenii XH-48]|uniref:Uncharacterized protein n=1 Tax=Halostagnicola larsenii XH-48 TaxID=797299 RepID=W0JTJ4_9EURY|nr:hypothetical protein HALLA_00980 [Halostagnicola larsenii XH-48]
MSNSGQQQCAKTVGLLMQCVSGLTVKYGQLGVDGMTLARVAMTISAFSATMSLFLKT